MYTVFRPCVLKQMSTISDDLN